MITVDVSNQDDMRHYALADEVTARCGACGTSWTYARHEALRCPMCAAAFTLAHFSQAVPVTYIDFDASGGATGA